MNVVAYMAFVAAGCGAFLGIGGLVRDRKSFVHWAFALGMILLSGEAALAGLSLMTESPAQILSWQRIKAIQTALLPGVWLLFGLSFGRSNFREFLARWKLVVGLLLVLPLLLALGFRERFITDSLVLDESSGWAFHYGWAGHVFHVLCLLGTVLVLMQLEKTLRSLYGIKRWHVKFLILGVGGLLAIRIYSASQVLLFSSWTSSLETLNAAVLLVAELLMVLGLLRTRLLWAELYISPSFAFNSLVILLVGLYLLAVGVLAKLLAYLGEGAMLPWEAFYIFITLTALCVFLLSDDLRMQARRLVGRHFRRPRHDYRKVWTSFGQKTSSAANRQAFCEAVVRMVSETLGTPSVTLWLLGEAAEEASMGASTALSENSLVDLGIRREDLSHLGRMMRKSGRPYLLAQGSEKEVDAEGGVDPETLTRARILCSVSLSWEDQMVGLLTLGEKQSKEPYSLEDLDLLVTMGSQITGALIRMRSNERLQQARQMEAFQDMAAFFVHDMKNLASTLSLLLQNLPVHYDNPEFRKDALAMISANVEKIGKLTQRLTSFREGLEFHPSPVDVDAVVRETVAEMNGSTRSRVVTNLSVETHVPLDRGQIKKVLLNLILNADEAAADGGEIKVTSSLQDRWAVISVTDQGCGMSPEYIRTSLFQPFKTTKKKGLGIGLYQSKTIVEAHGGRIEVESEEGKGSTFRVLLPVREE